MRSRDGIVREAGDLVTRDGDIAGGGELADDGQPADDPELVGEAGIIRVVARLDAAAAAEPWPDLAIRLSAAGYETIELAGALFEELPEPVYVWVEDDTAALVDAWGRLRGLLETPGPFVHHVFLNDGQLTIEARAADDDPDQVAVILDQHPGFDPSRTAQRRRAVTRSQYLSWWDSIVAGLHS